MVVVGVEQVELVVAGVVVVEDKIVAVVLAAVDSEPVVVDRKSTRLNSSH